MRRWLAELTSSHEASAFVSMSVDKIVVGRSTVHSTASGVEILIPAKRDWSLMLNAGVAAVFCATLTVLLVRFFIQQGQADVLVVSLLSLVVLAAGGAVCFFILRVVFWHYSGKEIITVADGRLTHSRVTTIWRVAFSYEVSRITALYPYRPRPTRSRFAVTAPFGPLSSDWHDVFDECAGGAVVFEMGRMTRAFGFSVSETEARTMVEVLRPFLPSVTW